MHRGLVLLVLMTACGGGGGGSGDPCATTDDCPPGQFCTEAGGCLPDGFCSTSADCADGLVCADDKCGPCAGDADCAEADFCSAGGGCLPDGTCAVDGDCADADFCSQDETCIPDGTCAVDGDCAEGMVCEDGTNACVPGSECGASELVIEAVPPNLLIALDRSCSMTADIGGTTKWASAVAAVNLLTTDYAGQIRWGLGLFPDTVTPSCGQSTITTPIGDGNEAGIQALLTAALTATDAYFPDGPCVTNIDTAMEQAAAQTELDDPDRKSFVMLITDGKQSGCNLAGGDAGTEAIIDDLFMLRDVITFVVGFGSEVDATQMNTFADNGGAPLPGTTHYYQADDQAELETALETIAGLVVSCDYVVTDPPDDLDDIYAFFEDTEQVPRDITHTSGWDFDPVTGTLTFYGTYCDRLQDRTVDDVDIVFGCPAPVLD